MRSPRGALCAVPHRRRRAPSRQGRDRSPPRPRLIGRRAASLRAACGAPHPVRDPNVRRTLVQPGARAINSTSKAPSRRSSRSAEAGVLDERHRPLERPPGRVVARSCCRGAYLRGAFLGGGSLTGPRSPHLEVRTPTPAGASFLRSVCSSEEVRVKVEEQAVTCSCLREGLGGDRGLSPRRRGRRRRPRSRGEERRRGDALGGESTHECRSCESRSHSARGATTARRGEGLTGLWLPRNARGAASRGGPSPSPPSGDVSPRARSSDESAGDEGGHATAPGAARRAR